MGFEMTTMQPQQAWSERDGAYAGSPLAPSLLMSFVGARACCRPGAGPEPPIAA
jgi:hypothetical protein